MLGRGLKDLPRDQIVVATKVGRYGQDIFDFSASRVKASVRESLARLQITYVDIIQTHDIEFTTMDQVTDPYTNVTFPYTQPLNRGRSTLCQRVGRSCCSCRCTPGMTLGSMI